MHVRPRTSRIAPARRAGAVVVALATVVLTLAGCLSGCKVLGGRAAIEDVTRLLPSSTTALVFTDREAMAKRLGVDDVSGRDATTEDVQHYEKAFADQGWGDTQLSGYLEVMRQAPFNELDVRWEASARWGGSGDGRSATLWRTGDKLDLGALGRSLTSDGYHKDTVSGLARYTIDFAQHADRTTSLVAGVYPAVMTDVLIDSGDHLVVGSQDPAALADIAAVATGHGSRLSDHPGHYSDLLDKVKHANHMEFAAMAAGDGICQPVTPYGAKAAATPDASYSALGHPEARALVATASPVATTNYLAFSSEGEATEDADARRTLISSGKELRTTQPFSQLGEFEVSHDGTLVKVSSDWATGPQAAVSAELTGGGPAACLPAS